MKTMTAPPFVNNSYQDAQSAFERAREGTDPTTQQNPQWARWLDMLNAAGGGAGQTVLGARGSSLMKLPASLSALGE